MKHARWWVLLLIIILCEKTTKYVEKTQRKSEKTVISGICPAFSAGIKFFSKIELCRVSSIVNAHLFAKNQKKLMINLKKMPKTGFSGIFLVFSAGKIFFSKIGLHHISGIAILHLCAKNQKKLMRRSREKLVTDEQTNERTDKG